MKEGKLDFEDLRNIILNNKTIKRKEVKIRNDVGEDCSIIDFGEYEGIFSTDPITGASENVGKLAVHINCNDIASAGGEPIGILVTILAPTSSTLREINEIMKEINEEAAKINVEIIGGHTEVTSAVNKMVISVTVIGKNLKGKSVKTAGAQLGDDIIVTKTLGLEGTYILINDHKARIEKILSKEEIEFGSNLINKLSVLREGKIGGEFGVNSMHDITEGGLLGGLFEVAMASNKGFKIFKEKIPMLDITKKVCEEFKIDPLRLISSGSMLITTKNGTGLIKLLNESGIEASIIGKICESGALLIDDDIEIEVEAPKRDELFNIQ
ncbi:AIR synthase family protein [Clostridium beijerinckii]|jgi:hydrogenase expression/formation protein HypE|uniref:AIR synthase family protein n=2 Tax=Clostridium beijerinckii TaxID=1520 RepID=A0AAE2V0C4_CLOBE|nr:AIR synthase family protein [Clostridium beijerinckii]ABR32543.1 AIR synthase related protein domain protein [Clostridium beijerinckii NCIMB 8052]AIU01719.1 AIR synthase-like protein [Clostridium beijerinckii ATCC 35702]MBF7807777.1 AIR synthase family protein [Clostridium beijerinckii]NOW88393.1 hydrogenase expression/formation protein HypE [Clostridium beijerinckii]NRT26226.1 hydrogenase expression/formation protein HypE [Clostridium beijerinckii]